MFENFIYAQLIMVISEQRIKELYIEAKWNFSDEEFSANNTYKPHTVILDTEMEIIFTAITNNEVMIYVPVFKLGSDEEAEVEKLKHMSSLVAKLNYDFSVNSAVSDGVFRLELNINVDRYDLQQSVLLLQDFLDDCDYMIAEAKNYDELQQGLYNHVPINFLMS